MTENDLLDIHKTSLKFAFLCIVLGNLPVVGVWDYFSGWLYASQSLLFVFLLVSFCSFVFGFIACWTIKGFYIFFLSLFK